MPRDIIPIRELIRRAGWAMVQPHRAFRAIRADETVSYPRLVAMLLMGGAWFIFWHTRFVVGHWMWELYYEPIILLSYVLVSVGDWLLASHGLHVLSRWLGRPVPLQTTDIAAFYLWCVWALMPVFDLPHAFGLKTAYVIAVSPFVNTFNAHLSWLVAFPILCAQLYFVLRDLLRVRAMWAAALLAAAIFVVCRFVLEPVFSVYQWVVGHFDIQQNFWVAQHYLVGLGVVALVCWRLLLGGQSVGRVIAGLLLGSGVFLGGSVWALQQPLVQNLNGPPPAPRVLTPIIIEQPLSARGPLSLSPAVQWGPFLDGVDHTAQLIVLLGAGAADRVQQVRSCRVKLLVHDGLRDDRLPRIQYQIGSYDGQQFHPWHAGPIWEPQEGEQVLSVEWPTSAWPERADSQQALVGRVAVRLEVRLHGGGDYTSPDVVDVQQVSLELE